MWEWSWAVDGRLKVAIVGSTNLSVDQQRNAEHLVFLILCNDDFDIRDTVVISGGAEGVDTIAETVAESCGFSTEIFRPSTEQWSGPGGYKERNQKIADCCDILYSIRSKTATTYGSGWTADRAEERLGKRWVFRFYV